MRSHTRTIPCWCQHVLGQHVLHVLVADQCWHYVPGVRFSEATGIVQCQESTESASKKLASLFAETMNANSVYSPFYSMYICAFPT